MIDFESIFKIVLGTNELPQVIAGFFFAILSALMSLFFYHGNKLFKRINLGDVLIWLIGVFLFIRAGQLVMSLLGIHSFSPENEVAAVFWGLIAGAFLVYLHNTNYKILKDKIKESEALLKDKDNEGE